MNFKIPDTFECGGRTITVEVVKALDAHGIWDAGEGVIRLKHGNTPDTQKQTFFHEATHAILDTYGNTKLSNDEDFVERIGQGLWQLIKTAK